MGFQPERASADGRINTDLVPPSRLIATAMDLAMMSPAEGYDKLVADFAAKGRRLRSGSGFDRGALQRRRDPGNFPATFPISGTDRWFAVV
jgi:hypothetical protein